MKVVLADFRPVYLTEAVDQQKLHECAVRFAEFVALADAARDGSAVSDTPVTAIREAWDRYGVSPAHIRTRRILVLPDLEAAKDPADIDYATIPFCRSFLERAGGADISERMAIYRRHARAAVEKMYPDGESPPDEAIHVSTTGYLLPSPLQELVSQKGWTQTVVSHCYHQGCYGAFPAVRMAAGTLTAAASGLTRQTARVDIAHTEICSIHAAPDCVDAEHIICDSLFADGFIRYSAFTDEAFQTRGGRGLQVIRSAATTIPNSLEAMTWRPIANRFEMTLSPEVPRLIAKYIQPFIAGLLHDTGLDSPEEASRIVWVIHPGGPAIVELVGLCLGLSDDQIGSGKDALRDGGNTSSATVPRIWDRLLQNPDVPPGTPVVSMAFGPGLTAAALVTRVV